MTPISAQIWILSIFETVGICLIEGPAKIPATIYPSTTGCFNFLNNKVINPAEINMTAKSDMSDGICDMDGARLANACAYLNCSMKAVTVDAGVDILSFGGTKNGMMMGESVVSFRPEISTNLQYFRKQSAQLASKLRYLSAQFIPYLENNLWLENAKKANDAALRLASVLKKYPQIHFTQKIESNQLFFTIPSEQLKKLQEKYFFYMWNEDINEARLVTSWDTTDADINDIAQTLSEIFPA